MPKGLNSQSIIRNNRVTALVLENPLKSTRIRIILYLLKTTKYGSNENQIGIDRLIQSECFEDAFPLHDGNIDDEIFTEELKTDSFNPKDQQPDSLRRLLRRTWATANNFICIQPLEQILYYFGAKTTIYFAWLGFYTQMLIPPAIFGVLVFLRGFFGFGGIGLIDDPVGRAMCNDSRLLCPRCDGPAKSCQFVEIRESCTLVKFTSLFDNKWTVWFALFIAVWAQLFCELWKRRQKWLTDAWNLVDESGDAIRIDFEKRTKVIMNQNFHHRCR